MAIVNNKKIYHDYEIIDKMTSGVELFGYEVKSIKNNKINITGAKIIVRGGEAFMIGSRIDPYQTNNTKNIKNYAPDRNIKLLLKKREISNLYKLEEKKETFVLPLSVFIHNNKIKIQLAICKKLKNHNKKQKIKERDLDRELRRKE